MSNAKGMQAKHVPDDPVLVFIAEHATATYSEPIYDNSVLHAMPAGTPLKVALAKMNALIQRGWVDGCGCGCMGSFTLTDTGKRRKAVRP